MLTPEYVPIQNQEHDQKSHPVGGSPYWSAMRITLCFGFKNVVFIRKGCSTKSLCTADASPPTNVQSWGCGSILSLHLLCFPMSSAVAILLCMSGEVVVDTLAICKARQALLSVQVCCSPTLMLSWPVHTLRVFQILMFICREVWITVIVLHVLREATLSNLPWLGVSYQRPSSVQSL